MSVSLYRLEMDKRKKGIQSILDEVRLEVCGVVVESVPVWSHDHPMDSPQGCVVVPVTDTPVRFGRIGSKSFTFREV
jgi:hypothetical protein